MPRRTPDYLDLLISWNLYLLCNHTRACIFESVSIPRCNPSSRTFKFDVSSLVGNCLSGVEAYLEVPLASRREENSEIRATSELETRFYMYISSEVGHSRHDLGHEGEGRVDPQRCPRGRDEGRARVLSSSWARSTGNSVFENIIYYFIFVLAQSPQHHKHWSVRGTRVFATIQADNFGAGA